jgi:hypothetical protein
MLLTLAKLNIINHVIITIIFLNLLYFVFYPFNLVNRCNSVLDC